MGDGQSKPTNGQSFQKGRSRERKPVERKEDLEAKDFADLAARCVPKALQEERKPRNVAAPPTAPPATPVAQTSTGPPSPAKRPAAENNLVRTDSQIMRASAGAPAERRLVRSNSQLVVPVGAVQGQVLVRSNSSIILSSGAVQAQTVQNLQRTDSNVISATVAAAQAQNNMGRATSLVIQKPQPQVAFAPAQAQNNMGRATSLVIQKPQPQVATTGFPTSYARPANAEPRTVQNFVRPQATTLQAPLTSQTSSLVPAVSGVTPPRTEAVPSSLRMAQVISTSTAAETTTGSLRLRAQAPVLKVRAANDEREILSRSALQTQATSGSFVALPQQAIPSSAMRAVVAPQSSTLNSTLKWAPPLEGALPQQPPADQGQLLLKSNLQSVQSLNIPPTVQSARSSSPMQAKPLPPGLSGKGNAFVWPQQVANPITVSSSVRTVSNNLTGQLPHNPGNKSDSPSKPGTLYTRQSNNSPRQGNSPEAAASEVVGGPSLIREMAAKYQDASPRNTDAVYQNKAAIARAMQGLQSGYTGS